MVGALSLILLVGIDASPEGQPGAFPNTKVLSFTYALRWSKNSAGAIIRCEILPKRLVESNDDRFNEADRANALSPDEFNGLLFEAKKYCEVGELKQGAKQGFSGGGKDFFVDEYERGFVEKVIVEGTQVLAATIFPARPISGKVTSGLRCSTLQPCSICIDGKKYFVPRNRGKLKTNGSVKLRAGGPVE
jgi:hypothetical protein